MNQILVNQNFKLYRSSAGSGKTYTLAKEYLKLALNPRSDKAFMHILAVTFTNKATQEMKERIITYLREFSLGRQVDMYAELKTHTQLDDQAFQTRCKLVLSHILHQYAHFSVSTIDAFFQKVIRAFAKEVGLYGGFTLEIDQNKVLRYVIDDLLEEIGENKTLTQWLLKFSEEKVDEGRSWDIRSDIRSLGAEVFKEHFKTFESNLADIAGAPGKLNQLVKEFQVIVAKFENYLKNIGEKGLQLIENSNLEITDFAYGKTGVANYFYRLRSTNDLQPKSRVREATDNIEAWYSRSSKRKDEIASAVESGLIEWLNEAVNYYDTHVETYESARQVLKNLYTFGILTDITRKLQDYKVKNDVMLISDAAHFLQEIIRDNDSPFIYEKVGSFYNHFLIDEFQDTSGFQWQNFKPLIENSLSEGHRNLLVGDVKQSIYRWRGGDWKLLLEGVEDEIHPAYIDKQSLNYNYRSQWKVINFNNAIFTNAAAILEETLVVRFDAIEDDDLKDNLVSEANKITMAYHDVMQEPGNQAVDMDQGFVKLKFFDKGEGEDGEEINWKQQAMAEIPQLLEMLQDNKVSLKDVAVLVRNGREGREIANLMLEYQKSPASKPGYNYTVVSNEALYLHAAPSVQFLINVLKFLTNPMDQVAKVSIVYEFQQYILKNKTHEAAELLHQIDDDNLKKWLPAAFVDKRISLGKLPLFEMVEQIIDIFQLWQVTGEWTYMQSFQNVVLNFSDADKGDINSFLAWWEENEHNLTIQLSDDVDALKILTIHKSKGLQFKVVLVPFLSWELDLDSRKNNIIWTKVKQRPFSDIGYFPLRYSSELAKTIFKGYYFEEMVRSYMDNLNLLYVAFTRAKEGLICYGELPPNIKSIQPGSAVKNVGALVHKLLNDPDKFGANEWVDENTYCRGTMGGIQPSSVTGHDMETVALKNYVSNSWRRKLAIKPRATDFFQSDNLAKQAKINYGLLIHDLLARIQHKNHLPRALQDLVMEGIIDNSQKTQLQEKMNSLFSHEMISKWFTADADWEVKTEVPILPKSGEMSRLDRVMTRGSKAIIIDFKTGQKMGKDQQQVMLYADLLREMGFNSIKAYLLYIEDEVIEEVI